MIKFTEQEYARMVTEHLKLCSEQEENFTASYDISGGDAKFILKAIAFYINAEKPDGFRKAVERRMGRKMEDEKILIRPATFLAVSQKLAQVLEEGINLVISVQKDQDAR